jgi:hypothetical protein
MGRAMSLILFLVIILPHIDRDLLIPLETIENIRIENEENLECWEDFKGIAQYLELSEPDENSFLFDELLAPFDSVK